MRELRRGADTEATNVEIIQLDDPEKLSVLPKKLIDVPSTSNSQIIKVNKVLDEPCCKTQIKSKTKRVFEESNFETEMLNYYRKSLMYMR